MSLNKKFILAGAGSRMQYFNTAKSILTGIDANRPFGTGQAVKIGGPVRFEDGGGIPEK